VKRLILVFICLFVLVSVTGCGATVVYRPAPELPELPAKLREPCAKLDALTTDTEAHLAVVGHSWIKDYRICQAKNAANIKNYDDQRAAIQRYNQAKPK